MAAALCPAVPPPSRAGQLALTDLLSSRPGFPRGTTAIGVAGARLTFAFEQGEAAPMEGVMIACKQSRLLEFMWGTDRIRLELPGS